MCNEIHCNTFLAFNFSQLYMNFQRKNKCLFIAQLKRSLNRCGKCDVTLKPGLDQSWLAIS